MYTCRSCYSSPCRCGNPADAYKQVALITQFSRTIDRLETRVEMLEERIALVSGAPVSMDVSPYMSLPALAQAPIEEEPEPVSTVASSSADLDINRILAAVNSLSAQMEERLSALEETQASSPKVEQIMEPEPEVSSEEQLRLRTLRAAAISSHVLGRWKFDEFDNIITEYVQAIPTNTVIQKTMNEFDESGLTFTYVVGEDGWAQVNLV